ncbi:AMP-binding protein [Acinetobacter puyangensis]|uniref:AMP-binding enzyme n=1 Tax=Acinetobacter puyangensis TaxID=1096779 RepID=A0A240E4V9_9GAMM|nr:AMP-binding protein [Acinetobacter puyangensis]SNX43239.1 AMP-binding enzyme [Acinetobacter puyangensis]
MKTWAFQHFLFSKQILLIEANAKSLSFAEFWQGVADRACYLQTQSAPQFALWTEDSYLFLSWLWAGLIAEKTIILPPHRIAQLEQQFSEKNIVFIDEKYTVTQQEKTINTLVTDWSRVLQQALIFFTSGSTGQPKQIPRTLQQLLTEVVVLQDHFSLSEPYCMLASVSHQHIYGILFKVLLPLMSGQAFYRQQLAYPEQIIAAQQQLKALNRHHYLIASPALLKRCIGQFDFAGSPLIFSSGGKLDAGIRAYYPQTIVEVFGSSETGGIATQTQDHTSWQSLADVDIRLDDQQQLWVKTAHAYQQDWIATGDVAKLEAHGFELLGRSDRIIKLEEKRLSLDAIEYSIEQLSAVQQCYALLTQQGQRELLSVVVVLSPEMRQQLLALGKKAIVAQLKQQLSGQLESIAMPRRWRFMSQIPHNAQGKISRALMQSLFQPLVSPVVLTQQQQEEHFIYQLEFLPELACFAGHFANFPVYPGVGQIGFLVKFSPQLWMDFEFCTGYEQLKFQDLIRPYDILQLNLQRQDNKVIFQLDHVSGKRVASGRLLFNCKDKT